MKKDPDFYEKTMDAAGFGGMWSKADRRLGWIIFWVIVAIPVALYLTFAVFDAAASVKKLHPIGSWHRSYATTYSWAEGGSHAQACTSLPLQNSHRSFAARDYQVPCGGRAVFCYRHRCVVGRRTDASGGGVASSSLDLNRGLAVALHIPSSAVVSADGSYPGGYTWVAWRRVR